MLSCLGGYQIGLGEIIADQAHKELVRGDHRIHPEPKPTSMNMAATFWAGRTSRGISARFPTSTERSRLP
jgi:hypothetical protein